MPTLGRRPNPPDSRDFPMAAHLQTLDLTVLPQSRSWRGNSYRVNQGNVGACVAFSGENWLGHDPIMDAVSNAHALAMYQACKAIDPWPTEEGTSDRYLMKVLTTRNQVASYHWAQTPADLKNWILSTGTVMVGTNWYARMFDPERSLIHSGLWLRPGNGIVGGHEWLLRRYYAPWDAYRMRNSWGAGWGENGEAWIAAADLYQLVFGEQGGDACAAIEKRP